MTVLGLRRRCLVGIMDEAPSAAARCPECNAGFGRRDLEPAVDIQELTDCFRIFEREHRENEGREKKRRAEEVYRLDDTQRSDEAVKSSPMRLLSNSLFSIGHLEVAGAAPGRGLNRSWRGPSATPQPSHLYCIYDYIMSTGFLSECLVLHAYGHSDGWPPYPTVPAIS